MRRRIATYIMASLLTHIRAASFLRRRLCPPRTRALSSPVPRPARQGGARSGLHVRKHADAPRGRPHWWGGPPLGLCTPGFSLPPALGADLQPARRHAGVLGCRPRGEPPTGPPIAGPHSGRRDVHGPAPALRLDAPRALAPGALRGALRAPLASHAGRLAALPGQEARTRWRMASHGTPALRLPRRCLGRQRPSRRPTRHAGESVGPGGSACGTKRQCQPGRMPEKRPGAVHTTPAGVGGRAGQREGAAAPATARQSWADREKKQCVAYYKSTARARYGTPWQTVSNSCKSWRGTRGSALIRSAGVRG
jgi:hypothetical protein